MIPAILSCVFVIYLYQTLNQSDEALTDGTDGNTLIRDLAEVAESLSDRMDRIQQRLDRLTKGRDS